MPYSRASLLLRQLFFALIILISGIAQGYDERFALSNNDGVVSLNLQLAEGHKIYWLNSGESGLPTTIDLTNSTNLADHAIYWPFPERESYMDGITNYIYKGDVHIPLKLKAADPLQEIGLQIQLSYIICAAQCVPIKQIINANVMELYQVATSNSFEISRVTHNNIGYLDIEIKFKHNPKNNPKFIILIGNKVLNIDYEVQKKGDIYTLAHIVKADDYYKYLGEKLVVYSDQSPISQAITIAHVPSKHSSSLSTYMAILMAFIGGFVLNFMPCVLPVLALKLMSATKADKNYMSSFCFTVLGIMTSFWILAIVAVMMKYTGEQFGIGMGFQQSEFIIFLCILITFFISISAEKITLPLPRIFSDMAAFHFKPGYIEDFMTGVISALLSIPCTAPLLGSAILVAVTGSAIQSVLIFTSAGLGFSLPYLMMVLSPKLLTLLPKPGSWMNKTKKGLTILLVASLMWLLWLIYGQLGTRATFGLFLLLMLIKFILEERRLKAKLLCLMVLIASCLYLPQIAHKQDASLEAYIDNIWQKFDRQRLDELVAEGMVVVVDVTADWCITCKYNKFLVWDREKMLKLLSQPYIVAMRADATNYSKDIESYLTEFGVYGIPFNVVYGSKAPNGLVMKTLVEYDDIAKAVTKARYGVEKPLPSPML